MGVCFLGVGDCDKKSTTKYDAMTQVILDVMVSNTQNCSAVSSNSIINNIVDPCVINKTPCPSCPPGTPNITIKDSEISQKAVTDTSCIQNVTVDDKMITDIVNQIIEKAEDINTSFLTGVTKSDAETSITTILQDYFKENTTQNIVNVAKNLIEKNYATCGNITIDGNSVDQYADAYLQAVQDNVLTIEQMSDIFNKADLEAEVESGIFAAISKWFNGWGKYVVIVIIAIIVIAIIIAIVRKVSNSNNKDNNIKYVMLPPGSSPDMFETPANMTEITTPI